MHIYEMVVKAQCNVKRVCIASLCITWLLCCVCVGAESQSSIFDPDFYGAVRLKRFSLADKAIEETYAASGMICYTYAIHPKFRYWTDTEDQYYYEHEIFHFVAANHIGGGSGNHKELNGAISSYTYENQNTVDLCVRKDPHRSFLSDSNPEIPPTFIDWLAFDTDKIPQARRLSVRSFEFYQCLEAEIPSEYATILQPTVIASIEHKSLKVASSGTVEGHYDAVWLEQVSRTDMKVCWEDDPQIITHTPVNISTLVLSEVPGNTHSFFVYLGKTSFMRQEFSWPADENLVGVCIEFAFPEKFDVTPFIFTTVELIAGSGSTKTPPYSWVESANERNFMACVTLMHWVQNGLPGGTAMAIHYFALFNPEQEAADSCVEGCESVVSQPAFLKMTFSDIVCFPDSGSCDFNSLSNAYYYLEKFLKDRADIGDEVDIHYFSAPYDKQTLSVMFEINKLKNPKIHLTQFENDLAGLLDTDGNFMDLAVQHIYDFVSIYSITKFKLAIDYGGKCVLSHFYVQQPCNAQICGDNGGTQGIGRNILAEAFKSAENCPTSNSYEVDCNYSPCVTSSRISELTLNDGVLSISVPSTLPSWAIPVLVVEAVFLVALIGLLFWLHFRKAKRTSRIKIDPRVEPKVIGLNDRAKAYNETFTKGTIPSREPSIVQPPEETSV